MLEVSATSVAMEKPKNASKSLAGLSTKKHPNKAMLAI